MPRRMCARRAGEEFIQRHQRRSRSAMPSSGSRASQRSSTTIWVSFARRSAATTRSLLGSEVVHQRVDADADLAWPSGAATPPARPCSAEVGRPRRRAVRRDARRRVAAPLGRRHASVHVRIRSPVGSSTGSVSSRAGRRWPMISISNPSVPSARPTRSGRSRAPATRRSSARSAPEVTQPTSPSAAVPDRLVADHVGGLVGVGIDVEVDERALRAPLRARPRPPPDR